ncbi:unnamed protein product [Effrenium voratum]|nr:unnamed protein product [Effrenium voratum]
MLKLGMTNPPYMLAHIDAVLRRPNVFEYLHVPVQSGSDAVLRAMVREYTSADFRNLVDGLRAQVPDLFLGTDVRGSRSETAVDRICGFPAEGEEDHRASMDLVREYHFPMLNISQFYPRPNTPAARLKKLPGNVVKARSTEMTQLFESYRTWDHLVGQTQRVWFSDTDEKHAQTAACLKGAVARTFHHRVSNRNRVTSATWGQRKDWQTNHFPLPSLHFIWISKSQDEEG